MKIVESVSTESFYGCLVVFNESDQAINEEVIFDVLDNFRIHGVPKGTTKITVNCPPGEVQSILLHRENEAKASFHFKAAMKAG